MNGHQMLYFTKFLIYFTCTRSKITYYYISISRVIIYLCKIGGGGEGLVKSGYPMRCRTLSLVRFIFSSAKKSCIYGERLSINKHTFGSIPFINGIKIVFPGTTGYFKFILSCSKEALSYFLCLLLVFYIDNYLIFRRRFDKF